MPRSTRPRRWLLLGVTILILAVVLIVGYRRKAPKIKNENALQQLALARHDMLVPQDVLVPYPCTLVPGISLLGGLEPAAAYVVETSEGLVLIDTGLDKDAVLLKRQMTELGLDWQRVRAILLTHVHGDHSGGAEHLRAATGAKVYAGQGDAAVLRAGQPREAFFSAFPMSEEITPSATTVDVELNGEQAITVGDVRFQVLATPGHTPGSVCYLMERGGQRVLFSGDVIESLSFDQRSRSRRAGPLGTYAAYLAPRYRGDARAYLSTLRRLRALPVPDLVLPGHPRNDAVPQSPLLSRERWEALLDAGISEMETLLARFANDGANFLDGGPKRLLPDLYYLGEFKNVAVYGFFAASRFFLVNAPGGPGLHEFLNARVRQLGLKPAEPTAVLLTSGNPEETAGLAELVEKGHPQVVASPEAWEAIKTACPAGARFLSAEDLPRKGWFPVTPMLLRGRGVAPVAYLVPWEGKYVLFSGRLPIKLTQAACKAFFLDFSQGRGNVVDYRVSLQRLGKLKPDFWLPAFPTEDQNANLYDGDWQEILAKNADLIR